MARYAKGCKRKENLYKALLDAEHRRATLPENARQNTKDKLDREVTDTKKYLLELQDQRDMYEDCTQDIWEG